MRWTVAIFLVLATMLLFSRGDHASIAYQDDAASLERVTSTATSEPRVFDATQNQDFVGLTLSISSGQSTYLVGEPLSLDIQLSNGTAAHINGHDKIDPGFGALGLMVALDGQEFNNYWGPGWGLKDTPIIPTEIQPGEIISGSTTNLYNHSGVISNGIPTTLAFPSAGLYILKAEFNDLSSQKIESQTLAIDVVAPQGIDADAWKLIRSEEAIYYLHTGFPRRDLRIVEKFDRLLGSYPGSLYAKYVDADVKAAATALHAVSPEDPAATSVVNSFAIALNARDYPTVVDSTSLEFGIRDRWDRGGEDQEEIRQGYYEISHRLGDFSVEIDHLQLMGFEATADITVISENLGTFNSYIILFKDSDGMWRIFETGF